MGVHQEFFVEDYEEEVLDWISQGNTLRSWCRIEGNPSNQVVYKWKRDNPEFKERLAHARDLGHQELAMECLEICDDGTNDFMVGRNGEEVLDRENIQRSKLRVETRLKLLAVWDPSKYGNKVQNDNISSDGSMSPKDLNKEELDQELKDLGIDDE